MNDLYGLYSAFIFVESFKFRHIDSEFIFVESFKFRHIDSA